MTKRNWFKRWMLDHVQEDKRRMITEKMIRAATKKLDEGIFLDAMRSGEMYSIVSNMLDAAADVRDLDANDIVERLHDHADFLERKARSNSSKSADLLREAAFVIDVLLRKEAV